MSSKKIYFVMLGIFGVLSIGVFVIVFLGNNMIKQQSNKLVDLKLENRLLDEQQTALNQANRDLEKYAELESISKQIVPQDKDQARTIREIIQIAEQNNIKIASVTFAASNLGDKSTAAPATTEGTDAAQAAPAPAISQAKPVDGIPGVYSLQMDIAPSDTSKYSFYQLINFLGSLENNRRTAQITRVKIDPDTETGNVGFTLTINTFIKP